MCTKLHNPLLNNTTQCKIPNSILATDTRANGGAENTRVENESGQVGTKKQWWTTQEWKRGSGETVSSDQTRWQLSRLTDNNYEVRFPSKRNARNARCVNENRKQRKRLIGCFDDSLFRSTIPIGWRLRALRLNGNRFYAMFFVFVILLRLLRFLRTFLTQSIALRALRALRLDGNRA